MEQNDGAIVNTSSVFGLAGMPNQSAYCSAKFAVRGFTDSLRQELRGTGVTAINVHPGGINTNIVRNARFRKDPDGRGRSHEQMVQEFAAITMTQPDKAAEIIHRGVEQGKARILVGPDAYVFDILTRLAPTHYYDVLSRFEARLRSRAQQPASVERSDPTCAPSSSPSTVTSLSCRSRSGPIRRRHRRARCRIAVRAAGVNFADHLARVGLYPDAPKPPCVVGYEVSGTIEAVGDGVDPARVGERVFGGTRFGGYAEIVNVGSVRRDSASRVAELRTGRGDTGQLRHRMGGAARLRIAARR